MHLPSFKSLDPSFACLIVIVTHNSERYIQWCLDGLDASESRLIIRIVDSGSTSMLPDLSSKHTLEAHHCDNIGFVAANNLAIEPIGDVPWILFLNPDARVEGSTLDSVLTAAESSKSSGTGVFTVPLVRYDIDSHCSLNVYDTVGIDNTWYGRWRDRLSGKRVLKTLGWRLKDFEKPEAICGAFMLVRSDALLSAPDSSGRPGFERKYFMYKEDIELSLRLRKHGWHAELLSQFFAYHCRGWNKSRSAVPEWARAQSAVNDLDIASRYLWRALPFALLKLLWVKLIERKWHSLRISSRSGLHKSSL